MIDQLKPYTLVLKLTRRLMILAGLVALAACSHEPDPNVNLYGTSVDKAFAILANADVPHNILGDEMLQGGLTVTTERDENKSIIWHFSSQNYAIFSIQANLIAEAQDATRVTVAVRTVDDPRFAQMANGKALTDPMANVATLKETIRQNFTEFVDATLTARPYDASRSGTNYAAKHQDALMADVKTAQDMIAQLSLMNRTPTATPAQNNQPTPTTATSDFGAPMMTPSPTSNPIGATQSSAGAGSQQGQPSIYGPPGQQQHNPPM